MRLCGVVGRGPPILDPSQGSHHDESLSVRGAWGSILIGHPSSSRVGVLGRGNGGASTAWHTAKPRLTSRHSFFLSIR